MSRQLLFLLFAGPGLWLLWNFAIRLWARAVVWKTVRVSEDVGVHINDLLNATKHEDALIAILRGIADENYLLGMRVLRRSEEAAHRGYPDAPALVAAIQSHLDDHGACPPLMFHGFAIPVPSLLATCFPAETAAHNARTAKLREHWLWASDWLWRHRFNAPRS